MAVEKVVILVADAVLGAPKITKGMYPNLDSLASRGQSGYLSTFTHCTDTITQLTGLCHHTPENLAKEIGPMKLCVLKDKSTYSGFGELISISGFTSDQLLATISEKTASFSVIVVETPDLATMDQLVGGLLPNVDLANVGICVICGYKAGAEVPVFKTPVVADPSWKVIGADVVETLSVAQPCMYISASQKLTRIDKVAAFDEADVEAHCGMGVQPICQLFREYSYYTGSSWKYGA